MASLNLEDLSQYTLYRGSMCSVGKLLTEQQGKTLEVLRTALAPDSPVESAALARFLKDNGLAVGDQAVQRHRRGACRCSDRGIS